MKTCKPSIYIDLQPNELLPDLRKCCRFCAQTDPTALDFSSSSIFLIQHLAVSQCRR